MKKIAQRILVMMSGIFLIAAFSGGSVEGASAGDYPTKPIEVIVGTAPGGTMDLLARAIADYGSKVLKQPMVVINRPGAGSSIAAADIVGSKADGYKVFVATNFYFATTVRTQKMKFDPGLITPLGSFLEIKQGLMVKGDSPWKNLKDIVEYAKKNPGKLKAAHMSRGSTQHLPLLLLFKGAEIIDIPELSSATKISNLLGGHWDAAVNTYPPMKAQIQAGSIRMLCLFNDRRFGDPAGVPSVVELGYPEVAKLTTYVGLFCHKNTPKAIKDVLVDMSKKVCGDQGFQKRILDEGNEPACGGPERMMELIKDGEEVGIPLIKKLGLYVEQGR